jgi:hypothetical protein
VKLGGKTMVTTTMWPSNGIWDAGKVSSVAEKRAYR